MRLSGDLPGAQCLPGGGFTSVLPATGTKLYQTLRLRPAMPAFVSSSTRTGLPIAHPVPSRNKVQGPAPRVTNTQCQASLCKSSTMTCSGERQFWLAGRLPGQQKIAAAAPLPAPPQSTSPLPGQSAHAPLAPCSGLLEHPAHWTCCMTGWIYLRSSAPLPVRPLPRRIVRVNPAALTRRTMLAAHKLHRYTIRNTRYSIRNRIALCYTIRNAFCPFRYGLRNKIAIRYGLRNAFPYFRYGLRNIRYGIRNAPGTLPRPVLSLALPAQRSLNATHNSLLHLHRPLTQYRDAPLGTAHFPFCIIRFHNRKHRHGTEEPASLNPVSPQPCGLRFALYQLCKVQRSAYKEP